MARLEVNIDGDAKGVSSAFNQAQNAVSSATDKINKGLKVSKAEIEAWDAAARKASQQSSGIIDPKLAEDAAAQAKKLRLANQDLGDSNNELKSSFVGTNNVAVEFSRIIQDAPYGIQGVANNIQQLGQSLAYEAKNAGSFGAALKTSLASLASPMSLMVIGISAVTVGWQLYSKWSQKAKKDTDDVKQSFDDYVSKLDAVKGSLAKGEAEAQKQITSLQILYGVTQNNTISIEKRRKAVDELQKQFPSYFGQLKSEQILAGEGSEAYNKLASSILATSQARAAADKMIDNSKAELRNRLEIEQNQELLNQAEERLRLAENTVKLNQQSGLSTASAELERQRALEKRNEIASRNNDLAGNNKTILSEQQRLLDEVNSKIKQGADVTLQFSDNVSKVEDNLQKVNDEVIDLNKYLKQLNVDVLNSSLNNAFDDLSKLRGELNKIYNAGEFNPFDLSGITNRPKQKGLTPEQQTAEDYRTQRAIWESNYEVVTNETKKFSRTMSSAINRAGREFYSTLTNLSSLSDATFGGIFASITEGLNSSMSEIFLGQMTDLLKKGIKDGTSGLGDRLGSQISIGLAAAGLAGGIISGLGSPNKPNYGAKIGGGALQGVAAGALIGGVPGAVIGGLVGAIGGLFGGKKREKELKLQEQQLAEQQKQTKLMERQNALGFLGNVVGRMVEGVGIIQGIDIGATGQLTARIEGRDIVISYDREKQAQKRGG